MESTVSRRLKHKVRKNSLGKEIDMLNFWDVEVFGGTE